MTTRFLTGNLFLLLSMVCAVSSQILLKALLDEMQPAPSGWRWIAELLSPERIVRGGLSAVLLVAGFLFWVACLVRLDLSYAYPVACVSVLFVTLFSVVVLGEPVTVRMWAGTALIVVGLILLAPAK
jgi:drug/metabolite transporter (DMT)-like permease